MYRRKTSIPADRNPSPEWLRKLSLPWFVLRMKSIMIVCLSAFCTQFAYSQKQYKRIGLEGITEIVEGKSAAAIERFTRHLKESPEDAESKFGLALAYASLGDIREGVASAKAALEDGLPIERLIAGPRPLTAPLWKDAEFRELIGDADKKLIAGPMIGNLTENSAEVWVRFGSPTERAFVRVTGLNYERTKAFAAISEVSDFVGKIRIDDLRPSSDYQYEILAGTTVLGSGAFKTFPRQGRPASFSVAFGGGAGYTPEHERVWTAIRNSNSDAMLMLGDNVYIDTPEQPLVQKYCYYRRQIQPEYRDLVGNVPVFAIWDDHDFGVNDCFGGPDIDTPKWKRPVFDLFKEQWINPGYGGGDQQPGCWYDFHIADVQFILLDGRYYRADPKGKSPSMLGKVQKEWLLKTLGESTATFKVLISPVPWSRNTKPGSRDTWDGYDQEREEIFQFLTTKEIGGVFLVAADRHRSDCWITERPDAYPLYEFMSSCLTNMHRHNNMPDSLFSYNDKNAFGRLVFDTEAEDPTVRYQIITLDGEMTHSFKLRRSTLE
ncbi:MAG: alkaline phosphatase D [Verrucomicrobiales bacterium]|jgi:alkaline phosphatase D